MLQIQGFTFNAFRENTYLLLNEKKQCWIVDPGMNDKHETEAMFGYLDQEGLKLQSIINTHTHIDHILGVQAIKDKYQVPFGIHVKDESVLQSAVASAVRFGLSLDSAPKADFYIKEGEALQLGDDTLEVRFTPGHSPGSIVFYYEPGQWLIGGDVLFAGSIGRTDLPGGDFDTLINSIHTQLFTLPDATDVYSGHGPATKIGHEKISNTFLI